MVSECELWFEVGGLTGRDYCLIKYHDYKGVERSILKSTTSSFTVAFVLHRSASHCISSQLTGQYHLQWSIH